MKGLLEDYRRMFHNIDELYYEQPKPEIKKLNDDLMFAVRNALKERYKLLGSIDKAKNELKTTYSKVENEYKKFVTAGVSGLKKRLESAAENLTKKLEIVRRKFEEVRSKRLAIEAEVKPLLKEGRIEEAEIYISQITALEQSEQLCTKFIRVIGRIVSRINGLLTKIDVLETLKSIQISKMDFNELKSLREQAESTLSELNKLQNELSTILSLSSMDVLSGTLSEDEIRTLKRLIEETEDVSEEVKRYVEELEDVDKKLDDLKKKEKKKEKEMDEE